MSVTCHSTFAQGDVRRFSQTTINNLKARLCASTSTSSCPDVSGSICVLSSDPDANGVYVRWTRKGGVIESGKPWSRCFEGTKAIIDECFQEESRIGGTWVEGNEQYELAVLKAEDEQPIPSSTGKYEPGAVESSTSTSAPDDTPSPTTVEPTETSTPDSQTPSTDDEADGTTSTTTAAPDPTASDKPNSTTDGSITVLETVTTLATTTYITTQDGQVYTSTYVYTVTNTQQEVVNPTQSPVESGSPDTNSGKSSGGLTPAASAGLAVGVTLFFVFTLLIAFFIVRRRRRRRQNPHRYLTSTSPGSDTQMQTFYPPPMYPPNLPLAELSTTTIHRAELQTEAQKGDVGVHVGGKPPEQAPLRMMRGGRVYTPGELEGCEIPIVPGRGELEGEGGVAELDGMNSKAEVDKEKERQEELINVNQGK